MTKYCPACGCCPNVQVEPAQERCPDCGKEGLKSVFELAFRVEEYKKFVEKIGSRINTIASQNHDYKLEKIAIEIREFNNNDG